MEIFVTVLAILFTLIYVGVGLKAVALYAKGETLKAIFFALVFIAITSY